MKLWYYYLHTNGELISKSPVGTSVADFKESDFVKKWWEVNLDNRWGCWQIVLEALALGARIERVAELVKKWNMDYEDSVKMLAHGIKPTKLMKDGMTVFIDKFLKMDLEEYWNRIRAKADV